MGSDYEKPVDPADSFPPLEVPCGACEGRGWCQEDSLERCGSCSGSGVVSTKFGKRVLRLVRHNFKQKLFETSDE